MNGKNKKKYNAYKRPPYEGGGGVSYRNHTTSKNRPSKKVEKSLFSKNRKKD